MMDFIDFGEAAMAKLERDYREAGLSESVIGIAIGRLRKLGRHSFRLPSIDGLTQAQSEQAWHQLEAYNRQMRVLLTAAWMETAQLREICRERTGVELVISEDVPGL